MAKRKELATNVHVHDDNGRTVVVEAGTAEADVDPAVRSRITNPDAWTEVDEEPPTKSRSGSAGGKS